MNSYAIVTIDQAGRVNIVLFPTLAEVEAYKRYWSDALRECYLWYVMEVLERSQAEHAAATEFIADH